MTPSINQEIYNPVDGRCYVLQPAINVELTQPLKKQLVLICNEPRIYNILFCKNLHNKPYTEEMAKAFFYWARNGWKTKEYFVFFVTTLDQEIISCVDIKSFNLSNAEIGYWSSEKYPGHMSNAVNRLCDIAKLAGYQNLYARVLPDNNRSLGLLGRTGFTLNPESPEDQIYAVYSRNLV